MLGLDWISRLRGKSGHPMSDVRTAAKLLQELPLAMPLKVIGETAAWLESVEHETSFTLAHRLRIVAMIDEAAHASLAQLTLEYVEVRAGSALSEARTSRQRFTFDQSDAGAAAQSADCWPVLVDYLEKLSGSYVRALDGLESQPEPEIARQLPLFFSRAMRAIRGKMAVGWLRYLPPDRASWESLVRCYHRAVSHKCASTLVDAYPTDPSGTSVAYEFAAAVMFAAAAPDTLPPRQIELAHRIASTYAGTFACSTERDQYSRLYVDLDRPGPPVRLVQDLEPGGARLFFGPGSIGPKLRAVLDETRMAATGARVPLGDDFGRSETLTALEHATGIWGDSPRVRRNERTLLDSVIHVVVGVRDLQAALRDKAQVSGNLHLRPQAGDAPLAPANPAHRAVSLDDWALTDFSSRGISARYPPRPTGHVEIGTLFGFRLERSESWCVAVVRRVRREGYSHTDVGAEILAKGAEGVSLELAFDSATPKPAKQGNFMRSHAVLLPDAPGLNDQPSLLFEPGTNVPDQVYRLHQNDTVRRIRLGPTLERIDGWDRVSFEWVD